MIRRSHHRIGLIAVLAALCALSIAIRPARADDWVTTLFQPTMSRADFDTALSRLDLNPEQARRIAAAHTLYLAGIAEAIAKSRAVMARMDSGEQAVGNEYLYLFLEAKELLDSRLESDGVASLADDAKAALWRSAIAGGRRRVMLRELSSNSGLRRTYDPHTMLDALSLTDAERVAVAPIIAAFEVQMDQALCTITSQRAGIVKEMDKNAAKRPDESDIEAGERQQRYNDAWERWSALTGKLTALIATTMPQLAGALDEHRQAFQDAWDRADYAETFVPCPVELAMNAIRMAEDVAADTRAATEAAFAQYQPARDDLTRRIVRAVRTWETGDSELKRQIAALQAEEQANPTTTTVEREAYYARLRELTSKHPAVALLQRRHDLAIDALKQLRSLFSDEEFSRLPLAARLSIGIGGGE